MKPGQIRPLYLEPRLHKQSVKQEINNHGTCLAKPLHTKQTKNVWRTIGTPSMRLLSDLPKICPLRSDEFKKLCYIDSQISVHRKLKKIDQLIFRNAKEIYFNEKFPIL
jgi:hypothetical protein